MDWVLDQAAGLGASPSLTSSFATSEASAASPFVPGAWTGGATTAESLRGAGSMGAVDAGAGVVASAATGAGAAAAAAGAGSAALLVSAACAAPTLPSSPPQR